MKPADEKPTGMEAPLFDYEKDPGFKHFKQEFTEDKKGFTIVAQVAGDFSTRVEPHTLGIHPRDVYFPDAEYFPGKSPPLVFGEPHSVAALSASRIEPYAWGSHSAYTSYDAYLDRDDGSNKYVKALYNRFPDLSEDEVRRYANQLSLTHPKGKERALKEMSRAVLNVLVPIERKRLETDPNTSEYYPLACERQGLYDQWQAICRNLGMSPKEINLKFNDEMFEVVTVSGYPVRRNGGQYAVVLAEEYSGHDPVTYSADSYYQDGDIYSKDNEAMVERAKKGNYKTTIYWNGSRHENYRWLGVVIPEFAENTMDENIIIVAEIIEAVKGEKHGNDHEV